MQDGDETVIGGAIGRDLQLRFRFWPKGHPEIVGVGIVDTGFPAFLLSEGYAERAGLDVHNRGPKVEFAGINGVYMEGRRATVELEVEPLIGDPLCFKTEVGVGEIPDGLDLLLGLEALTLGRFTIDGANRRWQWIVRHR